MITIKAKIVKSKKCVDNVEITEKGKATLGEYLSIATYTIDKLTEIMPKERVLEIIESYMESE